MLSPCLLLPLCVLVSDHTQDATITLNFGLDCSDTSRWPTSANSFVVVVAAADFLALDVTAAVAAFVGTVVRGTVVRARQRLGNVRGFFTS